MQVCSPSTEGGIVGSSGGFCGLIDSIKQGVASTLIYLFFSLFIVYKEGGGDYELVADVELVDELEVFVDALDEVVDVGEAQAKQQAEPGVQLKRLNQAENADCVHPELVARVALEYALAALDVQSLLEVAAVEADGDVDGEEREEVLLERFEGLLLEAYLVGNDEEHDQREQQDREVPERHERAVRVEGRNLLERAPKQREVDGPDLRAPVRLRIPEDSAVYRLLVVGGLSNLSDREGEIMRKTRPIRSFSSGGSVMEPQFRLPLPVLQFSAQ